MAGKIIADTIETGAGADISTSYVVNGTAKAWVNFNGTGTIAARDSLNVASLTDNSTGDYKVNYSNSFSNDDYSATVSANSSSGLFGTLESEATMLTGSTEVNTYNGSISKSDHAVVCLQTLGDLA